MRFLRLTLLGALVAMMAFGSAAQAQSPACPCTVFAPTDAPLGNALEDLPVEVGMKFRSDEDGYITALRFYKQPNNAGTHVGHLWTSSGQQLAEVTFTNETASGWQEEPLAERVPITRDTVYITSYHSSLGRFGFSGGYFFSGIDRPPLHAPADSSIGGNGVYRYGASGFPDQTFNATNYWVDAVFERDTPIDTRAPRVSATSPQAGATVPTTSTVTATFDEPLNSLTVNAGSFVLADAAGNPVAAQVTYDSDARKAILTPQSPLASGVTYTATVKGGGEGVADPAGNKLAADRTWSFSTPISTECPCTVFAPTSGPGGNAVEDQPVEVGMKFRSDEDGYITALRFYKQPNNTGAHVGHLWSGTGQLLAAATFTGETASGWQHVELQNPVPITRDTIYVTSYHSSAGRFPLDGGFFNQDVDRAPLHAPRASAVGGNGVYRYGASGFPDQTFNATNYWVDASFEREIPPDVGGPQVTELAPPSGASDVSRDTDVRATFDEQLAPASVTGANFTLRNELGNLVAADVSYDAQARAATLNPQAALGDSTTYTARIKGGPGGVTDATGNPLAADRTWTFTTAGPPPSDGPGGPIQVITDSGDPFGRYYAEILRAEGLNEFDVTAGPVTAQALGDHQVVVLATKSLSDPEVAELTSWVHAGGNLIAMRPDKKLAGLLGLTDSGGTRTNQYLKVDTGTAVGAGIESQTLQFHGMADRYGLNGATAVASLYSNASTATPDVAVSLRDLGTSGGQAASFAYDLARSVVYTRQGNPAWAGQKRDGTANGIRAIDLFYGAKAGDVQPDWVDMSKIAVPQADEQQRLLANLITEMNRDKAPLPRFWYLPRGEKAALVLTGDDHARNGTPAFFDRLKSSSPAGCSVADWECVRASSYLYPDTPMTDAQAAAYQADGFEVGLHLNTLCNDFTAGSLNGFLTDQLAAFASAWPSARKPVSNRTHCIVWSDWATEAKLQKQHGIRFDTNYYYNGPSGWLTQPGLLTGSGFPMRFADTDGTQIDVYQAMTQVTDESPLSNAMQTDTLLDNALGAKGWYGVITANTHTDNGDHANANDIVASAQERGVPVVSSAQMLDWLDGRNGSSFGSIGYSAGRLTFSVNPNPKARGLEAMLPAQSASGPLTALTRGGQAVATTARTVKGVAYRVFKATAGAYVATYANDDSPPVISNVAATADAEGGATITWETDQEASSKVDYGRTAALGSTVADSAQVTEHSVDLTGLSPDTTYMFRVTSADAAGNTATSPAPSDPPASFVTTAGGLVDNRTSDFAAGSGSGTYTGQSVDGTDGEVLLQPTVGEEFEGAGLPAGWQTRSWGAGGTASASGGALAVDGASAYTTPFYDGPRVLEFSAVFRPVNDQGVGFSDDLSNFPMAVFSTGTAGMPFQVYAQSGAGSSSQQTTPLPGVSLNAAHRFRIEWNAGSVSFFVDGANVANHTVTIPGPMRPVASDYGLFGAGVQVHWMRQGGYAQSGTFTSRALDSGPNGGQWGSLTAQTTLPSGTQLAFDTRSGSTPQPGTGWSAWQPVGAGGAIASPSARYIQYRARMASTTGVMSPILSRVQVGFGASGNAAPVPGSVTVTPESPRTDQTLTATPTGFSDPDGDPLTYEYQWIRNGTPIAGANTATLDLSLAGNGDGGDQVRVEVFATDGRGAATDPVGTTVTVANAAPTAGTVTVTPSDPATNDVVTAVPSGFADSDGGPLTYTYQWLRNGSPISGATGSTLDLSQPGAGDVGDLIEVDVRAVDGANATSPPARGGQTVAGTNAAPVAGTVAITPAAPKTDATLTVTPSGFREPDGEALSYSYRWLRNGTPIAGASAATLDLAQAGNGDRGDTIAAEMVASDPGGRTSTPAQATVTVGNSAPSAGTVEIRPAAPTTDDLISANTSGFADADGDAVSYTYQWLRNGSAIPAATGRTLDLSQPGNGDPGDELAVDVTALDGNGGSSSPVRATGTVGNGTAQAIAAFGFEEAAGTTIVDERGGPDGSLSGATRTDSGRFGRALSFDGNDDIATVPGSAPLDLTGAMTLEAWVRPQAATDWRTVAFKEAAGGLSYALYSSSDTNVPSANLGYDTGARAPSALDSDSWAHLAATYDGSTVRLFVNGTEVGSRPLPDALSAGAGPLTFGANNVWGEGFRGLIDEVRVYNRALPASEIVADMALPVVEGTASPPDPVDTQPPTAPGALTATAQTDRVNLSWSASTDDVAVTEYRVHRSTTTGFTPSAANRIATVQSGTSHADTGLGAGSYYYRVVAADAAGNAGPASNQAIGDLAAPTVALTAPAAGATVANAVTIRASASDSGGVQSVQFQLDGVNLGAADTTSPYTLSWNTRSTTNGSHGLTAVARDAAGNATTSAARAVNVSNTARLAAYGFEEALGTAVTDDFGNFDGTISGATRTAAGRFGAALTFDGINDWVTVAHNAALTPTGGMTLSAWVKPSALSTWRSVVAKERTGFPTYALYANDAASHPAARIFTTADLVSAGAAGLPVDSWSHLTMTWDSTALRLYVNGVQASGVPSTGPLATSNRPLRFGGNALRNEWFSGQIDEIRLYGRPLAAAEIAADMNAPVAPSPP